MAGTAEIIQDKTTEELIPFISLQTIGFMEWFGMEGTLKMSSEAPVAHSQRSWCCSRSPSLRAVDAVIPALDFWHNSCSSLLADRAGQARSPAELCRGVNSGAVLGGRKTSNKLLGAAQTSCEASPQIAFHARAGWKHFSLLNGSQTLRKGFSPA